MILLENNLESIKCLHSDELVDVQAMNPPTALFDLYGFTWLYDLGYGVHLDKDQCLKLIDWWDNKGGKEEYI